MRETRTVCTLGLCARCVQAGGGCNKDNIHLTLLFQLPVTDGVFISLGSTRFSASSVLSHF